MQEPQDIDRIGDADWEVYRCPSGCVHLRLQHVTLSFDEDEFGDFARLVQMASLRFQAQAAPAPHAH